MKVTSYFYTPPPFVDKASRVKEWVYNATEVFIQFCTERIWHYLDQNHFLRSHLQKINELCISEENSLLLEVHFTNICIILEKEPSLAQVYIDLAQSIKDISPDLLEIPQIVNAHPKLLETHLETMQKAREFKSGIPLLEIYLRTVKKYKNNPDNALTKQICGAYTSYRSLKKNRSLQDLFFTTTSHIWNLRKELAEPHLQSIHSLCNFKPLMLESHLTINQRICSNAQIFEIHLSNIHHLQPQFLECYINTAFGLKDNQSLLNLYTHTIYIIKNGTTLDIHQKNIQTICKLQPCPSLEAYFTMILQLENTASLESYIHGIDHINNTKNSNALALYLQKTCAIYHFNKDLLELHFQNVCQLHLYLREYLQEICSRENDQNMTYFIHNTNNMIHFSQREFMLSGMYFLLCQNLKNYQAKISHTSNVYFIFQKNFPLLQTYLKTILFLENTYPNLSYLHIENVKNIFNHPLYSLDEYISTVSKWIGIHREISLSLYIKYSYMDFVLQDHPELVTLYKGTYHILNSRQEDLCCHMCNVFSIVQRHPHLLKDYLEMILLFINTHSNLLWPHLKNTQNIYDSEANFPEYISKIRTLKDSQELLVIHICHTFNLHRLSKQHPSLLSLYHLTSDALEKHSKSQSYHIYNTYRISILLTQYLKRYLHTMQKVIPVWISHDEPKCSWLNDHLQSIQRYSFENASALQKQLQLISQIDAIFKGRAFFIEEILKNMQEEERREFIAISPDIMPYVIAKSIFLYGFHPKYHTLVPSFFNPKVQQEIAILRKESDKHRIHNLQKIFTSLLDFTNYWNMEMPEDDTRAVAKKMQNLWIDATQGENNLFMQCWKEASKALEI
ncbi:MAG: hypothetical protein C5B45_02910 [Chlamydiae bacterium]|nr:MAG: hypothetical protein C5B45_02910 [Chlamydiota bacterium]